MMSTHNQAILPDVDMIPNRGSLNDASSSNVNMVSDFHWIVVEISLVCLVWRAA